MCKSMYNSARQLTLQTTFYLFFNNGVVIHSLLPSASINCLAHRSESPFSSYLNKLTKGHITDCVLLYQQLILFCYKRIAICASDGC